MASKRQDNYDKLMKAFNEIAWKIKNDDCKNVFYELINQYSELCGENDLSIDDDRAKIEKHSMMEWIQNSVQLLSKNTKYQTLMTDINQLAEKWDDKYNREANKDCCDYKIRHKFFFATRFSDEDDSKADNEDPKADNEGSKTNKEEPPYTCYFNPSEGPDDRVILIVIDDTIKLKQNYEDILHEIGHYIGCRKRTSCKPDGKGKSRQQTGCEMIVHEWVNTVYRYMCAGILGIQMDEVYGNMRGDFTLHADKRKVLHNVLYALCNDAYFDSLLNLLIEGTHEIKEGIIKDIFRELYGDKLAGELSVTAQVAHAKKFKPSKPNDPETRKKRKDLICIAKGYLYSEINAAKDVFKTILGDPNRLKDMEEAFIQGYYPECERDSILSVYNKTIEIIQKGAAKADQADEDANLPQKEKEKAMKEGYHWVYLPESLLEEIAADIFLCKFGGVEKKYLDSILRGYALQKTNKEEFNAKLAKGLISNDSYRHRLIALTAALDMKEAFNTSRDEYIAQIERDFISRALLLANLSHIYNVDTTGKSDKISKIMARMNCVENPAIMASVYARMILQDGRYKEYIDDANNKKLIDRLRQNSQ